MFVFRLHYFILNGSKVPLVKKEFVTKLNGFDLNFETFLILMLVLEPELRFMIMLELELEPAPFHDNARAGAGAGACSVS